MKLAFLVFALSIIALVVLLTGCAGFGPTHVAVCKDGTCIDFTIPEIPAKAPDKVVKEVQPAP